MATIEDSLRKMKHYYDLRDKFFPWVEENCEVLYKEGEKGFTIGDELGRDILNPYIRMVVKLNPGVDEQFQKKYAALINAYRTAFPKNKKLPLNFPKVFGNVERVTVYENAASEHKLLTKDMGSKLIRWQTVKADATDLVEEEYKKSGLTYSIDRKSLPGMSIFFIDVASIFKKFKAKKIALKRDSGSQYRCRIKNWGEKTDTNCKVTYANLLTSGRLNAYLADINRQAQERFERLIEGMKQAQGITAKGRKRLRMDRMPQ